MKRLLLVFILFNSLCSFSQNNEYSNVVLLRTSKAQAFKGFSFGFLIQGQTKYPYSYYGPKVNGLYNDGAYHFIADFYIKKFLIGFQITDEYFYLKKVNDNGTLWKPRGFNGSYSSLTRSYWLSLGYNVYNNFNLKLSVGFRNGPTKSFLMNEKPISEIAEGFNYDDPSNLLNQVENSLDKYSEIDYSVSVNYPVMVFRKFGIIPEVGYSFNYGGLISGISIIFLN